jgi:hypothetical protein
MTAPVSVADQHGRYSNYKHSELCVQLTGHLSNV